MLLIFIIIDFILDKLQRQWRDCVVKPFWSWQWHSRIGTFECVFWWESASLLRFVFLFVVSPFSTYSSSPAAICTIILWRTFCCEYGDAFFSMSPRLCLGWNFFCCRSISPWFSLLFYRSSVNACLFYRSISLFNRFFHTYFGFDFTTGSTFSLSFIRDLFLHRDL